jgi:hypothetical protein
VKARLATVVALAIVSLMSGSGIADASLLPPLKMRNGSVTLCLTPAAQTAFTAAELRLDAIAPSTYSATSDGRSCVTFPIEGETNLDVTNAHANLFGGFDFIDADGRHLRLTDMTARTRGTNVVGTAKLDDRPGDVEVLAVNVLRANITPHLLPIGISATAPVTLTEHMADALRSTFGASPLDGGAVLFKAAGKVDLGPAIPVLP